MLAALGFIAAGIGIFFGQSWWWPIIVTAAAVSILIYFLFWDGKLQKLDDQGGVGILIDIAFLVTVAILRWL